MINFGTFSLCKIILDFYKEGRFCFIMLFPLTLRIKTERLTMEWWAKAYIMRKACPSDPPINYDGEHQAETRIVEVEDRQDIIMTHISRRHWISTASWGSHRRYKLDVNQLTEGIVFSVIPVIWSAKIEVKPSSIQTCPQSEWKLIRFKVKLLQQRKVLGSGLPSTVIHPLAQDFYGRLRTISFKSRHVEIVDKNDTMFLRVRSMNTFSPLV